MNPPDILTLSLVGTLIINIVIKSKRDERSKIKRRVSIIDDGRGNCQTKRHSINMQINKHS